MYFVKYYPLKNKLASRSLSDREALPYLVGFIGLTAIVGVIPIFESYYEGYYNGLDFVSGALSVILAIAGVIYSYRCNGGKEGFDIIQKYVVLGWVVAIRCMLAFIPLMFVIFMIAEACGVLTDDTGIFDVLAVAVFEIILYQRIGRHIRDTREISSEQDSGINPVSLRSTG